VTDCVLDTDVVIAALDRSDAHHEAATRLISDLAGSDTALLLSLVNYAETLVRPAQDERTLRIAVRAIDAMAVTLVAPTAPIAREAARLRGFDISLADGFALATARAYAATVASFDVRVRRSLDAVGLEPVPATH
jgi:predicted nucleic acid-binding protein